MNNMHRVKQTLGDIVELSGKEGRNSKAEIQELASGELQELESDLPTTQHVYDELRTMGVCRTMAVVVKNWSEQDQHRFISETRNYQFEKEKLLAHYDATFKYLKRKNEEND